MKITKSYLKTIIKEELKKIKEAKLSAVSHHPGSVDTPGSYEYTPKAGPSGRYDSAMHGILKSYHDLDSIASYVKTLDKHTGQKVKEIAEMLRVSIDELNASMKYSDDS